MQSKVICSLDICKVDEMSHVHELLVLTYCWTV